MVAPLYGENSTKKKKMFPKIELENFNLKNYRSVEIIVSCVTTDQYPRPHPYKVKNTKRVRDINWQQFLPKDCY